MRQQALSQRALPAALPSALLQQHAATVRSVHEMHFDRRAVVTAGREIGLGQPSSDSAPEIPYLHRQAELLARPSRETSAGGRSRGQQDIFGFESSS
jgi:hypothetical protein